MKLRFRAICAVAACLVASALVTLADTTPPTTKPDSKGTAYLFTYFVGNGEDGLHPAASDDGYKFEATHGGKSFLTPTVGESKLMRDPCIVRGPRRHVSHGLDDGVAGEDDRLRVVEGPDHVVGAARDTGHGRRARCDQLLGPGDRL